LMSRTWKAARTNTGPPSVGGPHDCANSEPIFRREECYLKSSRASTTNLKDATRQLQPCLLVSGGGRRPRDSAPTNFDFAAPLKENPAYCSGADEERIP
jgi:hypothetical protein